MKRGKEFIGIVLLLVLPLLVWGAQFTSPNYQMTTAIVSSGSANLSSAEYQGSSSLPPFAGRLASSAYQQSFGPWHLTTAYRPPVPSLVSPVSTTNTSNLSPTFICNATDDIAVTNLTFYLWNSSNSLIYNASSSLLSGRANSSSFSYNFSYDNPYIWNCLATDNAKNTNQSSANFTITIDTLPPAVTVTSPSNNSGDSDGNLTFNYQVSDTNYVVNCSLTLNSITNLTNSTITKNAVQNFTLTNLATTSYNWSINCTDSAGNTNYSSTRTFAVAKATEFSGTTTDLSAVNLSNITNLIIDQPSYGKINFSESVDLSNGTSLDDYVNISFNRIEINTSALPALNKAATLNLYNLTYSNPRVLRDGVACAAAICTEVSYTGNNFTFTVTQFSVYSAGETPVPSTTPSEGGGAGGGGGGATAMEYIECRQDKDCGEKGYCSNFRCHSYECIKDSDCGEKEACINHECVKLFDVKILRADSPLPPGDELDFTYFMKGMSSLKADVTVRFWLEKEGRRIASGTDTIYLGIFEEKTEKSSLYLPTDTPSGTYDFYVQLEYDQYKTRAHRLIQVGYGLPLVLDTQLSPLPSIKTGEPFPFTLTLYLNKDEPAPLRLEETLRKGQEVIWSKERELVINRSFALEEEIKGLKAGDYQLEFLAYYADKTSKLSESFTVQPLPKDYRRYLTPSLVGLGILFFFLLLTFLIRRKRTAPLKEIRTKPAKKISPLSLHKTSFHKKLFLVILLIIIILAAVITYLFYTKALSPALLLLSGNYLLLKTKEIFSQVIPFLRDCLLYLKTSVKTFISMVAAFITTAFTPFLKNVFSNFSPFLREYYLHLTSSLLFLLLLILLLWQRKRIKKLISGHQTFFLLLFIFIAFVFIFLLLFYAYPPFKDLVTFVTSSLSFYLSKIKSFI